MSTRAYAEFLASMGHSVREAAGVYWFDAHPRIYMSFPFQVQLDPDSVPAQKILGSDGLVLRYPCSPEDGRSSYRISIDSDRDYSMESLSGKARNQTRRGLERCDVRRMEFDQFVKECMDLNRDTLLRQGRRIPRDFDDYWQRYFYHAGRADGAQLWGAFFGNELAAYLIAFEMDRVSHILILRSKAALLRHYPNNALLYTYIKTVLDSGVFDEVSIGLESIQQGMEMLDRFKLNMGFRKKEVGQRIVFTRWLVPVVGGRRGRVLAAMLRRFQGNERLGKLAGMMQWYSDQEMNCQ
ncbi:MAG TPA: GNAT family N-acetyltransferase [Gammaproteobacteria bacterium]|nr:GNAT family N-acetyltransferase [Gammaproteobacteria bacterium]